MNRTSITVATVFAAALLILPAPSTAAGVKHPKHHYPRHASTKRCAGASEAISFYRTATWRWQTQRDTRLDRAGTAEQSPSCAYRRWAASRWRERARTEHAAYRAWLHEMLGPDWVSGKWGCIHINEGTWDAANDGYGGGLQMNAGFQHTYGAEFEQRYGPAGRWPVWAQLVAAERAFHGYHGFRGRGFTPWTTAAGCGL